VEPVSGTVDATSPSSSKVIEIGAPSLVSVPKLVKVDSSAIGWVLFGKKSLLTFNWLFPEVVTTFTKEELSGSVHCGLPEKDNPEGNVIPAVIRTNVDNAYSDG
jgi:hypothetical protein